MKVRMVLLAAVLLLGMFFSSCAKNEYEEEWEPPKKEEGAQPSGEGEQKPAQQGDIKTIDFILTGYGNSGQPENRHLIEAMLGELNARLADEIGAEIRLNWVSYNTYEESVMEMIAAEGGFDAVDIMSNKSIVFFALLNNDMLMDIRDDFRTYMPETYRFLYDKYSYLDEYLLTEGAQYVIPKIDAYPIRSYIITQKNIYSEYGKEMETLEDYEDYMQWISENMPEMTPGYASPFDAIDAYFFGHGYTMSSAGIFSPLESFYKAVPMERTPEFREVYEMLSRWNEKGYQGKINAGGQYLAAQSGKLASMLINPHYIHDDNAIKLPTNIEYEYIVLYREAKMLSMPSFSGPCVLKDADAKTELLKFYELIYTEQDFYDLVQYGIEGEHYAKMGEKITLPDDSNKLIKGWTGSGGFYNYSMERPLWSEPEDFARFFEEIAFNNMVTPRELDRQNDAGAELDEETRLKIDELYDEGIRPLLSARASVYERFMSKLGRGDYSMSVEEAIEMLDEGNTQELVDIYAEIAELYEKAE